MHFITSLLTDTDDVLVLRCITKSFMTLVAPLPLRFKYLLDANDRRDHLSSVLEMLQNHCSLSPEICPFTPLMGLKTLCLGFNLNCLNHAEWQLLKTSISSLNIEMLRVSSTSPSKLITLFLALF